MILKNNPLVRCVRCGNVTTIPSEWFDYDSFSIGEYSMATRIQHDYICGIQCSSCGQQMSVEIHGYEYPIGGYEGKNYQLEGCEVIGDFLLEMDYIPEQVLSVYEQILNNWESVYDLESWEFEELVAEVFHRNGFDAVITKKTRDGGKDIVPLPRHLSLFSSEYSIWQE